MASFEWRYTRTDGLVKAIGPARDLFRSTSPDAYEQRDCEGNAARQFDLPRALNADTDLASGGRIAASSLVLFRLAVAQPASPNPSTAIATRIETVGRIGGNEHTRA